MGNKLTVARQEKFLDILTKTGNITSAAAQLGTTATTIANKASTDPYFKEQIEIAKAVYVTSLEQAAHERAVKGVKKGIYFQGQKIDEETVYSDKLLETLLRANDPEKYSKGGQTNNTLVLGDGESTLSALGKFLGVDLDGNKEKEVAPKDIIDGEYEESPTEE